MKRSSIRSEDSPVAAHFVPLYLPRTETFIYQVLTHHRRYRPIVVAQHRVETASLFPFPELYTREELRARWSRHMWYERLQSRLFGRSYMPFESFLERRRARVLHVHFGHTGTEALPLSRKLGIPQVTAFYGWDDTVALGEKRREAKFARLFQEGELVLVEGTHIAGRLAARGCPPEKIRVHRIGVDVTSIPFRPTEPPRAQEPTRVLFCGRFIEKKGLEHALHAVTMARRAGLHVEFRVIGDGPLRSRIEGLIQELGISREVRLLGARTHPEFLTELAACHLFLQPSVTASDGETEGGAPTVLIEAQAAGKPILSTRHADIPEIVRPDESAVLVAEGDSGALGEALVELLRQPDRWAAMAAAGRRHVEAEHEIGRQMEKLEAIYDELRARR